MEDLKSKGLKIAVITSYSYLGEDLCAIFDLQSKKSEDFIRLFGDGVFTPNQVKTLLERKLIEAEIPFLYQTFPVRPLLNDKNGVSGLVIADRSGFQGIEAEAVVDSTSRNTVCRICGLPMKAFKPGKHTVERFMLSEEMPTERSLQCEKLPYSYHEAGKTFSVLRVRVELDFPDNSPRTLAKAETDMRMMSWTPSLTYAGDCCRMELDDGVAENWKPSDAVPVFVQGGFTVAELADFVRAGTYTPSVRVAPDAVFSAESCSYDIVRKDDFYRFGECRTVSLDLNTFPLRGKTDVFICGGGTGGAPAAIAAGREGASVLCAEILHELGGLCTAGRICNYWYGNRIGFTREMGEGIYKMGPNPEFKADASGANVQWKAEYLLREARHAGTDIRFGTLTAAAVMDGNRVCGTLIADDAGAGIVLAETVIDASGNSDVVAMAGGETVMASPDEPSVQGAGVQPIIPGNGYTNSDYQFICDHDILDFTRSMVMGRGKFPRSFDMTQMAGTRERRRIQGEITLQPQDFYAHRCYSDTVNVATSNFDTHGFIVHPMFLLKPTSEDPHFAKVPFRALLPRNLEGVLATGLAVSAHRDCIPLIRMQPDVQNHGYAAGLAAAMQAKNGGAFRSIDIRALQEKLIEEGCLEPDVLKETDSIPGPDPNDPHCTLSNVFLNPEKAIPELKRKYALEKDSETAALLAFLGEKDGAEQLENEIRNTPWDTGWNYRGMGQFGMSSSPLDVKIHALSRVKPDSPVFREKLSELYPDHEFSHFRAVCLALIRHPDVKAAERLAELLLIPGMSWYAVRSYKDALRANRAAIHDNSVRNCQLKELYLAKALALCDPGNFNAEEILKEYEDGLIGYYSIFAGKNRKETEK